MRLIITDKFDSDYLLIRRMVLNGKLSARSAKVWVVEKGNKTAFKAEQEMDNRVRRSCESRKHINEEDNWKNEVLNIYKDGK